MTVSYLLDICHDETNRISPRIFLPISRRMCLFTKIFCMFTHTIPDVDIKLEKYAVMIYLGGLDNASTDPMTNTPINLIDKSFCHITTSSGCHSFRPHIIHLISNFPSCHVINSLTKFSKPFDFIVSWK